MKKHFAYIFTAVALICSVTLISSCIDDGFDSPYYGNSGNHNNGGNQGGNNSGSDIEKSVEMNKISRVVAENWGQIWENSEGEKLPVNDWIVYLYGENTDNDNEYTMIEFLTDVDTKAITPGIYNEFIGLDNADLFKDGAVIKGYIEEDNTAYGTWYCKNKEAIFAASKGQLAVAVKDDLYSLSFDFIDEDPTYGGSFKGCYTGKIEIVDRRSNTKSGISRGQTMQKIQRNSVPSQCFSITGRKK